MSFFVAQVQPSGGRRSGAAEVGFTLIELLVVIAVIAVLTAITVPAIRTLSKSNDQTQASNLVRSMISAARSIAISGHRQAGVVFFEETSRYSQPVHGNQTAMQLFVEDYNQAQYGARAGLTVYVPYNSSRQYLPDGVRVAMLSDAGGVAAVENSDARQQARVLLFDGNGQLVLRGGMATPDPGGGGVNQGAYQVAFGDWGFLKPSSIYPAGPADAYSSPGFFIYNRNEMSAQTFASDAARSQWLKNNSSVVLINGNTGGVLR